MNRPNIVLIVADHAKRAMSTFPLCSGRYYGVDYAARARTGVPPAETPRQYLPPGDYLLEAGLYQPSGATLPAAGRRLTLGRVQVAAGP